VLLNYFQLAPDKRLPCTSVAIGCKHAHSPQERAYFEKLSLFQGFQRVPFVILRLDVVHNPHTSHIADQRPLERSPHFVALRLHKLLVSLVGQLVESDLGLVLVFLLEVTQLGLPFGLVLQLWIVELVLSLSFS